VILIFSSCQQELRKCKSLNNKYQGIYSIRPYKSNNDNVSLLEIFETEGYADSVKIRITQNEELEISSLDSLNLQSRIFKGKITYRGNYIIFLRCKRVEIPPLIPIFYGYRDVNRIKINWTADNDLIINKKIVRGGNIFIFGNEERTVIKSNFRKLK
jgi:hypothetical protein